VGKEITSSLVGRFILQAVRCHGVRLAFTPMGIPACISLRTRAQSFSLEGITGLVGLPICIALITRHISALTTHRILLRGIKVPPLVENASVEYDHTLVEELQTRDRSGHGSFIRNGKLYVHAGYDSKHEVLCDLVEIDLGMLLHNFKLSLLICTCINTITIRYICYANDRIR